METYSNDLPAIQKFVELSGLDVLEVGCGGGRISALLADKVATLTAIDPDKDLIEQARQNIDGVDFQVGSGEDLVFGDRYFDMVLFGYSLHHQDCAKAIKEAKRVLKQGGRILIIEPSHEGEYGLFCAIFEEDEIPRLRETLAYIKSSTLNISREETYLVEYSYKDEKELYQFFIDTYMTKKDDGVIKKMKALLGSKTNDRPIMITDKINIFLHEHG